MNWYYKSKILVTYPNIPLRCNNISNYANRQIHQTDVMNGTGDGDTTINKVYHNIHHGKQTSEEVKLNWFSHKPSIQPFLNIHITSSVKSKSHTSRSHSVSWSECASLYLTHPSDHNHEIIPFTPNRKNDVMRGSPLWYDTSISNHVNASSLLYNT